jgi:hypothetical protein
MAPTRLIADKFRNLPTAKKSMETWLPILLGGTSFFGLFPLLLFYFGTMRYQADFTPALILLSIYGMGIALKTFSNQRRIRQILVGSALILGTVSIFMGIYLGINSFLFQYCVYFSSKVCNY